MAEEVRLACTQGMLMCLDRDHRLTFILGSLCEFDSKLGAEILDVQRDAFRKRHSRARTKLQSFMERRCGVFDADNSCRCARQVPFACSTGMLDPERLRFARFADQAASSEQKNLSDLLSAAAVLRTHPEYTAPEKFAQVVKELIQRMPAEA